MSLQKIAVPTDDGQTIAAHFGRAQVFQVFSLTDGGKEPQVERRESGESGHHDHHHGEHHGHHSHDDKFALLGDCQVLIAGGMGQPAYDRLQQMGLTVVLTGEKQIERALQLYRAGTLPSDLRRVHAHHHHHHDEGKPNVTFFDDAS